MANVISMRVDTIGFVRQLDRVGQVQVPFAVSLTLNRTAEEAVQQEISELPQHFTIRNQWVAKGFRVDYARKTHLVATIRHKDPFMTLQEYGGVKRPEKSRTVAVPGPHAATGSGARPTQQSLTPPSKWPGAINRRFFIRKGDTIYEYARSGPRHRIRHKSRYAGHLKRDLDMVARGLDPNLKLMYVMKASVPVKPRLGLTQTITRTAQQRFALNLSGFLAYAIKTAK